MRRAPVQAPPSARPARAEAPRRTTERDAPALARGIGNAAFTELLSARGANGTPRGDIGRLPISLRDAVAAQFGPLLGGALHDVRLHTGRDAAATAAAFQARALTVGRDVWFGAGESPMDRRLLAHELTHVAQQHAGGARRGSGVAPLVQSAAHEGEARREGALAERGGSPHAHTHPSGAITAAPLGVQREPKGGVEVRPPRIDIRPGEPRPDGKMFLIVLEGVVVATVVMPKGQNTLPMVEMDIEDLLVVAPAESRAPERAVRMWIDRPKGVAIAWRPEAKDELAARRLAFEQALGPLRGRVAPATAAPAQGAPPAAAQPTTPPPPPPPPKVSQEEQDLLDEIDAVERYARKPDLTPVDLAKAFAAERKLQQRLTNLRHGRSEPKVEPAPEPMLRRSTVDPDMLTGRELGDEVLATRKWLAAQIQSSPEIEDVRSRLQPLERALERRSKSLQDAHRRINDLAKGQKAGVLLDPKQMGMNAALAFALAFLGAAEQQLRPVEFERLKTELIDGHTQFSIGATVGLVEGALEGLWDNIKGLAELIFKMSIFAQVGRTIAEVESWWRDPAQYAAEKAKAWVDAKDTMSALYTLLEQMLKDPMFLTLHAEELGVIAGESSADWFNDRFMRMDTFEKGELLGTIAGRVLLELALLFLGPEEWVARGAVAAGQAMRLSPKLTKAVMLAMEKIPALAKLMKLRPGASALREAVVAGKELKSGAQALEGAKDVAALGEARKGVEAVQEAQDAKKADELRRALEKKGSLPENVRELPPPTRPVEPHKDPAEVQRAIEEGKVTPLRDPKKAPAEPAAAPKSAEVADVPAETEGALALKRQTGGTTAAADKANEVTAMAATKRGGGAGGPPTRAPGPTTPARPGQTGAGRTGGGPGGGGVGGGVPGKMPKPTPVQLVAAPPGRVGPHGKQIQQLYPAQAWHEVADLESKFPKLQGKGTRPVYRGSGVGKLDERVTTTGTSYSFQLALDKAGAGGAKTVELDAVTAEGIVLDNKQLSSIEQRWQSRLEELEERHGPVNTFEQMSGADKARTAAARQRFEAQIEREVEDMGDQLSRQAQAIEENGLKGGEWTVPDQQWKAKLDAQLASRGIRSIKIVVR